MEIGCGVRIRISMAGGLLFWHYERANGRVQETGVRRSRRLFRKRPVPISAVGWPPIIGRFEAGIARKRARIEGLIAASHAST